MLAKVVFANGNGTYVVPYLVISDLRPDSSEMTMIYNNRWNVEQYYQSRKGNTSMPKSPTKHVHTQKAHIFAALYAFVKLERISAKLALNPMS